MRSRLYEPVKNELDEPRYAGIFADEPFARYGGLPGTTARLHAWCGALAGALSNGRLTPKLTAQILLFLEMPEREPTCKADDVVRDFDMSSELSTSVMASEAASDLASESKADAEQSGSVLSIMVKSKADEEQE